MQPAGFEYFRIGRVDGRTCHDDIGAGNILCSMSFEHRCTETLEAFGHGRFFEIRTGNAITEIEQHLSDAAHANTADADKMNALTLSEHTSISRSQKKPSLFERFFHLNPC